MGRTVLTLLLVSVLGAPAKSQPQSFAYQWEQSWNRHHRFGADGWRAAASVKIVLLPRGKLRVEDAGRTSATMLTRSFGVKKTTTQWQLRWGGSWLMVRGRLLLSLKSRSLTCQRRSQWDGRTPERQPCPAFAKRTKLQCQRVKVQAKPQINAVATASYRAWECLPVAGQTRPGGAPTPWVLGETHCLLGLGGKLRRRIYLHCK